MMARLRGEVANPQAGIHIAAQLRENTSRARRKAPFGAPGKPERGIRLERAPGGSTKRVRARHPAAVIRGDCGKRLAVVEVRILTRSSAP